jgi:hypothetical protein
MKKLLILALVLVALATVGGLTFERNAAAQQQIQDYRAGTAPFAVGQDGINITFSSPMPNTRYAVFVQETNTAGYSPISDCTYFNPLHKRADGFEVQHKRCNDGVPVKLDVNVSLDWMVVAYK